VLKRPCGAFPAAEAYPATRAQEAVRAGYRGREASVGIDMMTSLGRRTADYMPITYLERRYLRRCGDTVANQGFYGEGRSCPVNRDVHTGGVYGLHFPYPV